MSQKDNTKYHVLRIPDYMWVKLRELASQEFSTATGIALKMLNKELGTEIPGDKKNKNVLNPKSPTSFPVGSMDASGEF